MAITRRNLIKHSGLASLAALGGGWSALAHAGERLIPWRNWSGGQACVPEARLAPRDEVELAEMVKGATGNVRAVGSGHSFSPLVPTDGTIVSLSNLPAGVIGHNASALTAEIWAGTRIADLGAPLKAIGQALPNMADIDYQTLAGAISTSTHGTGPKYGSYSTRVIGLRMVTAKGEILDVDTQNHPEIFGAARVSLGALGVVTRVRLQNRKAFRLHRREWVADVEDLLAQMPQLIAENDHFEINALLHSDVAVATALNEATDNRTIEKEMGGDVAKVKLLQIVDRWAGDTDGLQAALLNFTAKHLISFPEVIDDSWKVFANVRDVRFNEMEYSVPAEAG
ncbi:MAG TPA: FAD-binding protein, partial [Nevskiaceae bacterium]|nr:FAD-binding protein [Nevskiaceae bacterium]